jgi:Flp pilus assembly protein TadD
LLFLEYACGWFSYGSGHAQVPSSRYPGSYLPGFPVFAQQQLGTVVGEVRVQNGDFPPQRVLVSLIIRNATMESVYTDGEGKFGFFSLPVNLYFVDINDDNYLPVHQRAELNPVTLTAVLRIILVPKPTKQDAQQETPVSGGNPNVLDAREYSAHFPKKAVKEFQKGVEADAAGKTEDAIRHYQKAIEIAPDFYPAHNNLGTDEMKQNDLKVARGEFEKAIQLNQSDAAGYFNLANVYMLMDQLGDAQRYLDEGMRRQPDSALGRFLSGSLHLRRGLLREAELELRQAVELSPTMVQARLQLVNTLLKEGKKNEARQQLQEFLGAFPASPFRAQAEQLLHRLETTSVSQPGPS